MRPRLLPQWPGQLHDVPGVPCRNYRPKPVLPQGDGVRLIPLGDGFYAYADAADYEWLSKYRWRPINGYAGRHEKGKSILMHREIMQPPRRMVVDHTDANKANNCRFNLRVCTPAENQRNHRKRRSSRSRFKGVFYHRKSGKWCSKCRFQGRIHCLGYFDDEVEAARAYDRKAVELFGEFARLNFPEEWPPQRRQEIYAQSPRPAESSFARTSTGRQRTRGKKVGRKEGQTAPRAKPRATSKPALAKARERRGTEEGKSKKVKGKTRKPRAETPGRRDRRRTTEKKGARKRPRT